MLALGALSYLWVTPGVAHGFFDMFVLAFVERLFRPTFRKDDFILGKKLGEGAVGVVYRVSLAKKSNSKKEGDLVLKKATEFGAVEIWMIERVQRACANSCADFVYGFLEVLISADLRVGINYIPKEFLLDPRYAALEQYIMSTQTPSAPSAPVATALSPVLWQAFPSLRTDSALIQFNCQLKRCDYDLVAWRKTVEPRASPDLRKGFELLDLDNGIGWELLSSDINDSLQSKTKSQRKSSFGSPLLR
ncbi:hypothetical protein REPUB_Repub04eG0262800 [Reevesia pubescens]